ncbi:hypothetical protein [Seonamhaeicola marinus]|uniref:Uncharacterized protein n=1 Tax=Seonamhaeicola marinus TaxID=1912246 RepID=A0A5D0J968_9FLAO|nr:hypothetical protein [Seonamhaeicola marinus]TYA92284.1 hypothetical protein FUA24_02300 [Seonamhaeicola marinus]
MDNNTRKETKSTVFSNTEKELLKKRILKSVSVLQRRRRIRYASSIAASIIVLIGFGYYQFLYNPKPDILEFVNTNENNSKSLKEIDFTTIVLSENNGVKIDGINSTVVYS